MTVPHAWTRLKRFSTVNSMNDLLFPRQYTAYTTRITVIVITPTGRVREGSADIYSVTARLPISDS